MRKTFKLSFIMFLNPCFTQAKHPAIQWRFTCLLLLAMTFATLNVFAQLSATYYVSAARGNDANAGNTAGLPFKTLTKALAVMRNDAAASVTILVEKGSYRPSSQGADIDATYR